MLAGDVPRARELLAGLATHGLTVFYQSLEALIREGIEIVDWPPSAGRLSYFAARRRFRDRLRGHRTQIDGEPMLRQVYHRLLRRVALDNRSYLAALWHWLGGLRIA
ncbi:MAG: hypothetical protein HY000_07140 [Planctomycetes bacterium]|nr:hypothetical protein [Planctomycetota bacterium]